MSKQTAEKEAEVQQLRDNARKHARETEDWKELMWEKDRQLKNAAAQFDHDRQIFRLETKGFSAAKDQIKVLTARIDELKKEAASKDLAQIEDRM